MKKIIVKNLKYRYPLTEKLVLDDVSFDVEQGEFIGIIGKNQSGKSTLCQSIVGLIPHFYKGAYGGTVLVDGLEVRNTPVSEMSLKAGIVFQNPFNQVTGAKLTVYEEIAFGLENIGLPRSEMIERIDYALDLLRITEYKNRNPFDLSGGQMQRTAIASMIAMKPQIIVLDEPTSQLDPEGSEEVFQAIKDLSSQGMTVLIAEHKMEKLAEFCDRVLLLNDGKLVDIDSPEKIFSREDLQEQGIQAPIYTRVCRALGIKKKGSDYYPVTLDEAAAALGGELP
ncbi:energy-coupling factor ABC transporter ATP-binding protein [Bacillus sp. T33-2]|uniref:energy-coupling factor ABC transporter ATP-binding protein n=1 Tax=Bacillus sp. T33-2 TaxID=2054168 RepID=UPI000C75F3F8|nr:ATP-binding cassette domain-containing protein [Bacillus sp. T33-2]PLR96514.1 cobalt ABC transporter ATP-binding protein [Bacillus sp. T33-2]